VTEINIPFSRSKNGITIEVKVEPRSSRKGISGIMENSIVKVALTSPPVDGAANDQLIDILSDLLKVKRSQIRIIRGLSSKRKVVEISGIDAV
jgi:uncharacterized protein (TIGR00251 family)